MANINDNSHVIINTTGSSNVMLSTTNVPFSHECIICFRTYRAGNVYHNGSRINNAANTLFCPECLTNLRAMISREEQIKTI